MGLDDRIAEAPMAHYQKRLEAGELAYQFSPKAGRAIFYPRIACPYTGSTNLEWRKSSGRGTIYTLTKLFPSNARSYAVALVDMLEGFRLMTRIVDATAEDVEIGARVALAIRPGENGDACPFFVLEGK
ncbi:MAG: OB-fold domain-containing protein [Rhodobiaceae bacterium]|nr:OB-fold domain-containing protein [Rhodobiaceae bacterium]